MATLLENANRIKTDKENIRQAIISKGVDIPENLSLDNYSDKIRSIQNGNMKVINAYVDISAGTWKGKTLSDSSFVALANSSGGSSWTYYYGETIDPFKIVFASFAMIESTNWIRYTRGYDQNSTTPLYTYSPTLEIYGNKAANYEYYYGGLTAYGADCVLIQDILDNQSGASSSAKDAKAEVKFYNDRLEFLVTYNARGYASIKSTTPKFTFTIGLSV